MIEFGFRMRICLHLESEYEFKFSDGTIIETSEIYEPHHQQLGYGDNVEIISDVDSGFRFTTVKIKIPDPDPLIPSNRLRAVYERAALDAFNKFIDVFRLVTGRYGIANVISFDDFIGVSTRRSDETTTVVAVIMGTRHGDAMTTLLPTHSPEEHKRIQKLLSNEIPLEKLFSMEARRYQRNGHAIQSLINAVIALDIVTIRPKAQHNIFTKIGTILLKLVGHRNSLKQLVTKKLAEHQIDQRHIINIKNAIKERDRVIHGGRRQLRGNIDQYLESIELAIETLT